MLTYQPQLKAGDSFDTGKKFIDADGNAHVIYQKTLAIAVALPNNNNINVAHLIDDIDPDLHAAVVRFSANTGAGVALGLAPMTITITDTNINIATTANLSAYTTGLVSIEYCKAVA